MITLILFHLIQFLRNRIWEQHGFFYVICNNLIFVKITFLIKQTHNSLKQNTYLLLHIAYPYHKLPVSFLNLSTGLNNFVILLTD